MVNGILHTGLIVADINASLHFYCGLLKLTVDTNRPDLGYPGAWINVGNQQQIHLLELPNPDPTEGRPIHGGRDRHTALAVTTFEQLIESLDDAGMEYTLSHSGRKALFCRDPDGNTLEFVAI